MCQREARSGAGWGGRAVYRDAPRYSYLSAPGARLTWNKSPAGRRHCYSDQPQAAQYSNICIKMSRPQRCRHSLRFVDKKSRISGGSEMSEKYSGFQSVGLTLAH